MPTCGTAIRNPREKRKFFYSNVGIGLLGQLIEIKTGRRVTDLILEKICRPLGLNDSGFALSPAQQQRLTVGHTGNQACWKPANSPLAPWDMGEIMRPSAGMYSTPNDLLIFAKANLGLFHHPLEAALASTHRIQVQTPRGGKAFGWIINRFDEGRLTLTFKDGVLSGYCAYLGLNLDQRLGVVVMSNKFSWDNKVGHNLLLRLSGAYKADREKPDTCSNESLRTPAQPRTRAPGGPCPAPSPGFSPLPQSIPP